MLPRKCALTVVFSSLIAVTLWAAEVPRPEFPEPQFQRSEWVSLNGQWTFAFDDNDDGLEQKWQLGQHPFAQNITVPYCFESKLSGVADTSFHPVFWYERAIQIPASWKSQTRDTGPGLTRKTKLRFQVITA